MKKPELLAPAGSYDSMRAAVNAGADAIYIGGPKFGARAYAENPDNQGLIKALDYCHFNNRKLYLTVNTLMKEDELFGELYNYIRPLYEDGLDAVIVQDYGAISFIRENFPGLPIHASTQMAVSGYYGARLLKEMGVCRVVLPRELSVGEIISITERGGLETEVFIHGALCYCLSGQCLMSSLIGGRSGNRGRCAQVCRLPFPQEHLLNLKDLNTLSILPNIIDTGVSSLKIEGRMKSPRYTAGVTSVYRKYIDLYAEKGFEGYKVSSRDTKLLKELFDRGGTTNGYFVKHNGKDMIYKGEKPEMRTPDEALLSRIDKDFIEKDIKTSVHAKASFKPGMPAVMELSDGHYSVTVYGDIVQKAQSKPLLESDIRAKLSKFGESPMQLSSLDIELSGDIFMPVSAINALRRNAIEELTKEKINGYKRTNF